MIQGQYTFKFSSRNKIVIGCTITILGKKKTDHLCESCSGCEFMGKTKEEINKWKSRGNYKME